MSERGNRIRSILGASAGNLVEWFDWYVYSACALYFAPVFFPAGDRAAELLSAAAVFAVGFLMRPLGGWLMGMYADRRGRKAGLTLSVLLMCSGSLIVACTPGYASIGVLSPVALVVARLMQGLSVGGEYGASATYLAESAEQRNRGLWSSLIPVTLIGGQLLALSLLLLLQVVLDRAALAAWGWRIPFAIGGALAVLVFWLRRGLVETASFENVAAKKANEAHASSATRLLREHPREAAVVVGLTAGGTLAFYTFTTYMQKYLVVTSGFEKTTASRITAAALLVFVLLQPAVGALSDRVGRRPVMIAFGVGGTLFTAPVMYGIGHTKSPFVAFFLLLAGLTIVSGYTAINPIVKAELFPANIRALGVALPFAIATTMFGGTAEYVALWFKTHDMENGFLAYVTAGIALSLVVYVRMRDTRDHSRIVED